MADDVSFEELMQRSQVGDTSSYQRLLEEVTPLARHYLQSHVFAQDDIEDVLQEVLISVHRARHTYEASRPFKPWLYAIIKFRLADYLRKFYRHKEHEVALDEDAPLAAEGDVTDAVLEHEVLYEALDDLPQKQKEIVVLMKVDGYTAKEVAQRMDMSESAVKVSAHRAYKVLKEKLEGQL